MAADRVFGRHVRNLAFEDLTLNAAGVIHRLGDAEVGELHLTREAQKHVGR